MILCLTFLIVIWRINAEKVRYFVMRFKDCRWNLEQYILYSHFLIWFMVQKDCYKLELQIYHGSQA
jgi:hypothetical protein